MVKIRCTRIGRVNRPFFRIAVFDSRTRRDGRTLDHIGYYDPILSTGQRVKLDKEKVEKWLKQGAKPTPTVASFLKEAGIAHSKLVRDRKRNDEHAEKRKASRVRRKAAKKTATKAAK